MKKNPINSELNILIKNLNSSEKAYYKKMAKRHADDNKAKHLLLFDIIDKNVDEDPLKICKRLNITSQSQFSSLKTYLLNDILDTLSFLKRNDDEPNVYNSLIELEILLRKRLFGHAAKLVDKVKQSALKYQYFNTYMQVLKLEFYLIKQINPKGGTEQLEKINKEIIDISRLYFCLEVIQEVYREMVLFRCRTNLRTTNEELSIVEKAQDKLAAIKLPDNRPPVLDFYYHCAATVGFYLTSSQDKLKYHYKQLLCLWQKYPDIAKMHFMLFADSVSIIFYTDFLFNDIEAAQKNHDFFDNLAKRIFNKENEAINWKIISFHTRLKIAHKKADYDTVAKMIKVNGKDSIFLANEFMPQNERLVIFTSIAISYFVLGRYKDADNLLFEIKELNRGVNREDVFYFALIFHLAVIYELKEWYRLHTAVDAAYQQLYAKNKIRPFEKDLLLFLKKYPSMQAKGKAEVAIANFLRKLDSYKNDPVKRLYFLYFNYYAWLESKMQRISYIDYMKNMHDKIVKEEALH